MAEANFDNQPTAQAPEPGVAGPPPAPVMPPRSNWRKLIGIGLIVAVVVATGVIAYRLSRPKPAAVEAKNEIPLITYGTADGAVNNYYPNQQINVDFEINQQVFEGLVQYEDQTRIKPLLAESWTNPDDSTWLFKLRPNVKFHTGRTMRAQDVKHSLESVMALRKLPAEDPRGYYAKTFAGTIKSVKAIDESTVEIKTDGTDPILLNKLVFLYIVDAAGKAAEPTLNGTGAYIQKPGSKLTEAENQLVAFDDYHGGRPLTRALTFKAYKDEATLTKAMQGGKVNIAADVFDQKNVDGLSANAAAFPVNSIGVYYLGVNHNKKGSPLQKLKVRQAIYEATDIPALLKARNLSGTAASQIVTQDVPGYNPAVTRPALDAGHAKRLLKEAGYPKGVRLQLTYFLGAQDAAVELKRQLAKAGITITLDGSEDVGYLNRKMSDGTADLFFANYTSDVLDAIDVFTANFQSANYNKPAVNTLIKQANQTLDPAKRLETLQTISKKLMDDVAWVPLYSGTSYWMLDRSYVVVKELPGTNLGAYFWKVYAK